MSRRTLIGAARAGAPHGPDRREALRLLALASAAAAAGCSRPRDAITPHVDFNGEAASGAPVRYATALELGGYARGVLGVVVDERPVKVQGNPGHPASLGSTDPFLEAAVLDLFDPQRSTVPMRGVVPNDWTALQDALRARLATHQADRGAGLALLTGRVLSPTVLRQIEALKAAFPRMRRARFEPVHDDAERAGSNLAHGRVLELRPRLEQADTIVCLDADPLGPGPDQIRLARGFSARRRPEAGPMSRLYVVEPALTPTGVMADARIAARPQLVHDAAVALACACGAPLSSPALPALLAQWVAHAARDLKAGRGLVLAGRSQAPEIHALAAWINGQVHAPVDAYAPLDPVAEGHAQSLAALAQALHAGQVQTLLIIDSDPLYAAPAALEFEAALRRAPFTLHAGLHRGATGRATLWHAPLSHPFESWSDARAFDGTASLVQPLVEPLYDTRTAHALLAGAAGVAPASDLERVRQTWAKSAEQADFAAWQALALAEGVIAGSAAAPVDAGAARLPQVATAAQGSPISLVLRPSPQVWDGRFAANAWLQECPEPITKETWGASLRLSPADAERLKLADGQAVAVRAGPRRTEAILRIDPDQAEGAADLPLGFGHSRLGPVANGVGCDVMGLRDAFLGFVVPAVELTPIDHAWRPPVVQHGLDLEDGDVELFPVVTPTAFARPPMAPQPDLLPPPREGEVAWGMVIDTSACIGCNACVLACQSENNIPVIGPAEIARQRDMHWLRVDRYALPSGRSGFQPVPCMQCEEAPCEPVCPVEASVHDHEGLNDQVYNRCIGTRFCEANCPYKVRRFNFRDYQAWPVYGQLDPRSIEAQRNPEVSVRARGVMEKCTYCVQRLSAARRTAEKEDRAIGDGEARTACQDACPTQAISFGNLADPASAVAARRRDPRHYVLLEELKTRPRTTYLARAVNPAEGET